MVKHIYKYKVKYGFESSARVSIEAGPDLEKVIYAWLKQTPVAIGGRMINGKHIISIEPDYHHYTGWYEHYQPESGDDWKQIERDCPSDLDNVFNTYVDNIRGLIRNNQTHLIGTGSTTGLIEPKQHGAKN